MAAAQVAKKFVTPVLPMVTKIAKGTIPIILQEYEPKYHNEIQKLYTDAAEKGDGYTREEVEPNVLKKKIATSTSTLLYLEESTKEVLCVNILFDSPICRSNKSMLGNTAAVVNPKTRGQGIVRESYVLTHPITISNGYFGIGARIALTARNVIPTLAIGSQIAGSIPMCSLLEKHGYIDDLIVFHDHRLQAEYPDYYQKLCDDRNAPLPPLNTSDEAVATLAGQNDFPTKEVKTDVGMIRIKHAQGSSELLEVERLIRASAEKGRDFALDEFDKNGFFNRKLLRSSDIVIAEEATSGDIVGGAVMGPSSLTRSPISLMAHQYMAIKKKEYYQPIGTALLNYGITSFKKQGYKGVLSDVYLNSYALTDVFRSNHFVFRGSMPYAGYKKVEGPVASMIVYCRF